MNNPGVKNGLFLGASLIVFTLLIYLIAPKFFVYGYGFAAIGISLLIYILFMVKAGNETKALNEGFASFSEVLKPIFLAAVIGGVLSGLFTYVLHNMIDPSLSETLMEATMSSLEESSFISEDQLDELREQVEGENNYSLGKTAQGLAFGAIVGFIMSLIIAAIIKKERPYDNTLA